MKIICIGRNYADHAKELGNQVPDEPVIFMKPDSAILPKGNAFFIPEFSNDVHFECEVVVCIDRLGKNIEERFASRYYSQIALGIDFTARDLQQELKAKSLPWEKAKSFDGAAFVGKFFDKSDFANLEAISFQLKKNGEIAQSGNTSDMLFSIDRIIAEVSKYFTIKIGDLIYTGTPAGVAAVAIGDELELILEGRPAGALRVK
ncbi:MAG: 2-hydroxyhepta-2,4-diene-1,7-dioate isomerase [Bacteroidetes bacterium]|nr:MAG: 2-hydroxyhepta-2,4-diene-1,7-dioate isomerase [Bacteroidota bacterium]